MIWASFVWSLIRILLTLVDNKSIHLNHEKKMEAEQKLRIKKERRGEDQGCCDMITNFLKDSVATTKLKVRYTSVPLIKVLPSVAFRLLTFWLILSYCTEFYLDRNGNKPGWALLIPAFLLFIIWVINFLVGYWLGLDKEEATVNSFSNLFLPLYVDLLILVSVLKYS